MEQRLQELDAEEQTPYHLNSRRDDKNLARKALLAEVEAKLPAYGIGIVLDLMKKPDVDGKINR